MNEKNIEYRSENFYIRKTDDRDYDNFRKVCEAEYLIGRIYKHQPKIAMKCFWETLFEGEDIHYSIFLQDGEFLGRVSLQYGRCKYPEIAIVVVKKYQNQGYGFKLLKEWCSWVHEVYGYSRLDILIDAGEKASASCTVVPFLLEHVEDKKLEMIITTHADSDHLGGMVGLSGKDMYGALEAPGIEYQYIVDFGYEADSKVYKDYVELRNARVQEGATYLSIKEIFNEENLEAAAHFYLGEDMFLDFLDYKTYGMADIDDDNDRSVSCLLTHDEKKILLCGDSEKKEESYLTKLNIGKVDVFKANHHGSPTSNTKNLLDQIRPEYVVICSSEENKYNLPKKTIISRLIEYTQNVYATFISGNIEVISKNNNITITSVKALIPVQNSTWYLTDDPNNPIK